MVTYANWVAKTAALLSDELGLERGGSALVDLPTHWLGPVWLGALWSVGVAVTDDRRVRRRWTSSSAGPRARRRTHAGAPASPWWRCRCCRWRDGYRRRCPPG